jgi:uncharacterized protein YkwD
MPHPHSLRHLLAGIIAIATLMLVAPGGTPSAEASATCGVADTTFDEAEQAFLGIINQYRTNNGLQPLTVSVNLNQSASWMAQDLATKNYFSHRDSMGRDSQTRIAECGATMNSGENLAAGTIIDSAVSAFGLWRSSSGHNQNMLFPSYTQIGIARAYNPASRYKWYWVTTFSVPDDGTRMSTSVELLGPTPHTQLNSTTVTFKWASTQSVDEFRLDIGSKPGGNDIYSASQGEATAVTVSNLPWQSKSVFVRLWARVAGVWEFTDYAYQGAARYE